MAVDTRYVTHSQWTSYTATQLTYPSGRQVASGYDALYRRNSVTEVSGGTSIAQWQFFGPSRTAELTLGNGLIQTQMNNARTNSAVQLTVPLPAWGDVSSDRLGYDGAGRMITKRFLAGGIDGTTHAYNTPTSIVGYTTSFDPSSNKLFERALHAESRSACIPDTIQLTACWSTSAARWPAAADRSPARSRCPALMRIAPMPWITWATGRTPLTPPSAAVQRRKSAGTIW